MLKIRRLVTETAVANQSGAMETDTILKNGRSSKSQTSSINPLTSEKGGRHFINITVMVFLCYFTVQMHGQTIEQQLLSQLHKTSSTSTSDANKWTKIADCTITAGWEDLGTVIDFMGTGAGSSHFYYGTIIARFKNSNGSPAPVNFYNLLLLDSNLGAENVKAIRNGTNVALYIRIPLGDVTVFFKQTLKGRNGAMTAHSNQPFLTSLPANDLVIDCVNGLNILTNGRVGIGTNTPRQLLEVAGIIRAVEVRVVPINADFVFDEDYELRPLEEVEQFIKENRHLPDFPSAAQMDEDEVIGLAEMNKLLLQKIEELTLYVIELKKENETQQKVLDELKKEFLNK
ncbi:MAG: hypothetical protein FWH18_06260 [Marinilabiliaceae bacterium]|nr:hypothetical protein [Marinilabiliaceae bacterium]